MVINKHIQFKIQLQEDFFNTWLSKKNIMWWNIMKNGSQTLKIWQKTKQTNNKTPKPKNQKIQSHKQTYCKQSDSSIFLCAFWGGPPIIHMLKLIKQETKQKNKSGRNSYKIKSSLVSTETAKWYNGHMRISSPTFYLKSLAISMYNSCTA